jgi:hypothetical protein
MSALNRKFLHQDTVYYSQPPEFSPETKEARLGGLEGEEGWTSYVGQMVRSNEEVEGEARRRPREVDPRYDTTIWHRHSSRPEKFLHMPFPAMAMNAYYRTLIQGTGRSFNPLFFVLLPNAARAIQRRDQWLRASWPFFYERVVPCEGAD